MTPYNQLAAGADPRYENEDYKAQMPDLELVRDVYAGSRVIKGKSTEYLPQEPKETDEAYAIRLKRSGWWGGFRKVIRALVGMVARKPAVLSKGVAQQILDILDNIDLQGNDLATFVKDQFRQALQDGHSFILIDMPRPLDPAVATLADERGRRPYWCPRKKCQVINWQESTSDAGEIVLTQVTIYECLKEPAGRFAETEVDQWRVLALVNGHLEWEIWREQQNRDGEKEVYLHDGGIVPQINFIPLVMVPTNATGFLTSDPPLKDLADLNVSHYQLWSDIKNIIHRCCVPILAFFGREEGDAVEIGPNAGVDMPQGGDVKYVEPTGAGIASAQEEMKCTERLMGVMGLELLAPRSDVEVTATQSAIDDSSQISELGGMVESLDNAVNQALYYTARFLGLTEVGGTWKANKDFNRLKLDSAMLQAISNQVTAGQLSLETLWWQMERGELLPPDFDPAKEKMLIGEQQLLTPKAPPVIDPALGNAA